MSLIIKKQETVIYKYILTNPSIGGFAVYGPQNCKSYAERRNAKCQIWYSPHNRYFDVWLRSMLKPSETALSSAKLMLWQ